MANKYPRQRNGWAMTGDRTTTDSQSGQGAAGRRKPHRPVDGRAVAPACRALGPATGGRSSGCCGGAARRLAGVRPGARAPADRRPECRPGGDRGRERRLLLSRRSIRGLSCRWQALQRARSRRRPSRQPPPCQHPLPSNLRRPHRRRPRQVQATRSPPSPRRQRRHRRQTVKRPRSTERRTLLRCSVTTYGRSRRSCGPLASIRARSTAIRGA